MAKDKKTQEDAEILVEEVKTEGKEKSKKELKKEAQEAKKAEKAAKKAAKKGDKKAKFGYNRHGEEIPFLESRIWKLFNQKLNGIGASVVIVGALFKIMHFPGAGPMLTAGLLIEAAIFFVGAFEPMHDEVDWTILYPQLDLHRYKPEENELPAVAGQVGTGSSATNALDQALESAEINPEMLEKLKVGMEKLSNTANNLGDISNAKEAINSFSENMNMASISAMGLDEALKEDIKSHELFNKSFNHVSDKIDNLANAYEEVTYEFTNNLKETSQAAYKLGQSFDSNADANYNLLYSMNSTAESFNASAEKMQSSIQAMEVLDKYKDVINDNIEHFQSEIDTLQNNLGTINTIYTNMLAAMKGEK